MPTYTAPLREMRFLLEDVLHAGDLTALPGNEETTLDLMTTVLEEGAHLCEDLLAPLNQTGDAEGCHWEHGCVTTPSGFRDAYRAFCEAGWPALSASPKYGGQGLPHLMQLMFDEMLCSANLSFSMYPLLANGATHSLDHWGSEDLKTRFLPALVSGRWSGTMCLTEAHAGTDLGMIRTRAVPCPDGSYEITGTKIFISAGEHDLAENIIHLVLAKLPDAPPGTKGISLFVVPKLRVAPNGDSGTPNGVTCGSIEHKMGIKANATCVINFDGAQGWLVGEPHKGMRGMFTMMNSARLSVGMQGLGLAEVAYQNALAYTRERVQGRAPRAPQDPSHDADPIIVHPDIRRMLMTMKAYIEGMRALAYWVGLHIDVEAKHPEAARREEAADILALMTPVIKGFCTDVGFEITNLALQCYGGHGYIREFGMEQFVRDARIAQIYEGTNGVQAMDLLGRKIPDGDGRMAKRFFQIVERDLAAAALQPALQDLIAPVAAATHALQRVTMTVMERARTNVEEVGAAASEYLRLFGLVATGWMWVRLASAALVANDDRTPARLTTAKFYISRLLPQTTSLATQIVAGAETVMALTPEQF